VNGAGTLKRVSGARLHAPVEEREVVEGRQPSGMTTWLPRRPFRVLPQQYLLNLSHLLWKIGWRVELINAVPVIVDSVIVSDDEQLGPVTVIRTPGHSPGSCSFYWQDEETLFAGDAVVTWPRLELGWKGLTEDFRLNVESIRRLVQRFEERGWSIRRIATGHGPPRDTDDGIRDLKRLLEKA
jgi:glyoxylase-like metal-dependent hydrolase (beta-lactamase superfamily II)